MAKSFDHTSLLFAAGHRPERYEKALQRALFVCFDLEDSVPLQAREAARSALVTFLGQQPDETLVRIAVRISHPSTPDAEQDIAALKQLGNGRMPAFIIVPMVESKHDIKTVGQQLELSDGEIIALIETPKGVKNAMNIAELPQVSALMFGGADLAAILGVDMAWEPLFLARSEVVMAAAGGQKASIDVPFLDVKDHRALREEAGRAKGLGFTAKAAIHPDQVKLIEEVFQPTGKEIADAKHIVEFFGASDGAAQLLDGKMIEAPVIARAKRLLKNVG